MASLTQKVPNTALNTEFLEQAGCRGRNSRNGPFGPFLAVSGHFGLFWLICV